jgi:hypothetical protein
VKQQVRLFFDLVLMILLSMTLKTMYDSWLELPLLAGDSREIEEVEKEWEHTLLQNSMDRELHELNKRLEQKEVCLMHMYNRIHSWHVTHQPLFV